MSQSSKRHRAIRILLLAGVVGSFAPACDSTRTIDPTTTDDSSPLQVPDHSAYGQVPSGFSATALSWSQISISWAKTPSATGYEVFRSTGGVAGSYAFLASTSTATTYIDTGLTGSTEYCYEIRSIKTAGKNVNYSAFSTAICATTLAPLVVAPSATDAVPDGFRIQIKWKDNSPDESGFHIERAAVATGPWSQVLNAPANATSAYVSAVTEQLACFRVIAFNATGPSLPSTPDCTTSPASPTNLLAKADQQSITLSWTDNSRVEDGFKVYRAIADGAWTEIASLPSNAVSYGDVAVSPNVGYSYYVQALKDGGFSAPSDVAIGVISTAAPAMPTDFSVAYYVDTEGYGWNYLVIWWRDASANEDGFQVEYSADRKSDWSSYATAGADTNYVSEQFSVFAAPPPSACYRVSAFNSFGASNVTDPVCVEPGIVPTDLNAIAIDQHAIDLTWTDNANLEIGYAVIRSSAPDGIYEVVATLPANATSYPDTGLVSGQEYWYAVASVYGPYGGWSDYSNFASATTALTGAILQGSPNLVGGTVTPRRPVRVKGVTPRVPPKPGRKR
jgi:hypothetical protein